MLTRGVKTYSSSCSQTVSLFCSTSFLECALQPKIAKINKTPYFRSSGSFKVSNVDMTKKLMTSACCDKQHAHATSHALPTPCASHLTQSPFTVNQQ